MTATRINLQNTPTPSDVVVEGVSFERDRLSLHGTIHRPADAASPIPAVVVTGAWATVKEQMAGTYAREMARRGFSALAFDFAGWGESAGEPRYLEDPEAKTKDILAAVDYLADRADVDSAHIYALGICASAGYMAKAAADSGKLAALALVAAWLHDADLARSIYGGDEAVARLIAASAAPAAVLTAASTTDETAVMYQAPYYTEPDRGLIPAFDNKFNAASWKPWLTYDAFESAPRLDKPLLMVGSASMALPAGAASYEARTHAPLRTLRLGDDVTQFDFYDREDVVRASADAVAAHFNRSLLPAGARS